MSEVLRLSTLDELAEHVHLTLCGHDRLDPVQTPMQRSIIQRRGKPCGLFFQIQGPRLLRTYAVWAGDENRIIFYDAAGERFAESRLSEAPDPRKLAA